MVKGHDPDLESSDSEDSKHRRNRLGRGAAIFMVLPVSPHAGSGPTDVRLGPQMTTSVPGLPSSQWQHALSCISYMCSSTVLHSIGDEK